MEVGNRVPVCVLRRRSSATIVRIEGVVQAVAVRIGVERRPIRDAVHVCIVAFDEVYDAIAVRVLIEVVWRAIPIRVLTG